MTASCQAPPRTHPVRIKMLRQTHSRLPCQTHTKPGIVLSRFALTLFRTHRQQREWRIAQTRCERMRVFLSFILTEQRHLIPIVLFKHQFSPHLRVRRQPAFSPHIPAVCRTGLIVMVKLRRTAPVAQTKITITRQLQIIPPVLHPDPQAAVITCQVMVIKQVQARHVGRGKMAPAGTGVKLITVIRPVEAVLGEKQVFRRFIPRQQQVGL